MKGVRKYFGGLAGTLMVAAATPAAANQRVPDAVEKKILQHAIDLIGKTAASRKQGAHLQEMLNAGDIRVNDAKDAGLSTVPGGAMVLPKQHLVLPATVTDPLDFAAPEYTVSTAMSVAALARILVRVETYTRPQKFTRRGSRQFHHVGLAGSRPQYIAVKAWQRAIGLPRDLLNEATGPHLNRQMRPVLKMIRLSTYLKLDTGPDGKSLNTGQGRRYLTELVALHKTYGNEEYMRELRNRMMFMAALADDLDRQIRKYNLEANPYAKERPVVSQAPAYWKKSLRTRMAFLQRWQKHLVGPAGDRAGEALYLLNGGTHPPATNIDYVSVMPVPQTRAGGALVVGKPGSAVPGASIKITLASGRTFDTVADESGAFRLHVPDRVAKDELKITQRNAKRPPLGLQDTIKAIYKTRGKAAFPVSGFVVTVFATGDSRRPFDIAVENQGRKSIDIEVPAYTVVAVSGGNDALLVEGISGTVRARKTRHFRPAAIAMQIDRRPRNGPVGTAWLLPVANDLDTGAYAPATVQEMIRDQGYAFVTPPAAMPALLDGLKAFADEAVNQNNPIDADGVLQWAVWHWQGARVDEFRDLVMPQLAKTSRYKKGSAKKKKKLEHRTITVPFERVRRLAGKVKEETLVEYTEADVNAAMELTRAE